jgi:hypothetical protein
MHDSHKHHAHDHDHEHEPAGTSVLRTLEITLEHWIDHSDSHAENYREWAAKAGEVGEEEIAKEIYLAVNESASVKSHLKRARAILAAKLVLKK